MSRRSRVLSFAWTRTSLNNVLTDHGLASLGDSYINFVYSLALSNRKGEPEGTKVKGSALAEALRRAGLREHLASRMSKHALADAAEALLVYAWLGDCLSLEESVMIIGKSREPVEGLTQLIRVIRERITFP